MSDTKEIDLLRSNLYDFEVTVPSTKSQCRIAPPDIETEGAAAVRYPGDLNWIWNWRNEPGNLVHRHQTKYAGWLKLAWFGLLYMVINQGCYHVEWGWRNGSDEQGSTNMEEGPIQCGGGWRLQVEMGRLQLKGTVQFMHILTWMKWTSDFVPVMLHACTPQIIIFSETRHRWLLCAVWRAHSNCGIQLDQEKWTEIIYLNI